MKKRLLSTLLALCMVLTLLPTAAFAVEDSPSLNIWDGSIASSYAGGSGTSSDPYLIATAEQLARVADRVNSGIESGKSYRLLNDIYLNDVSSVDYWAIAAPANEWTPIGSASTSFSGTFNGAGYSVRGLYISTTDNYQGLFGRSEGGSTITNLGVEESYIKGGNNVSAICGYRGSAGWIGNNELSGLHSGATVIGTNYVGGIFGRIDGELVAFKINNCYNTGKISGEQYVGGIVGGSTSVYIYNSYNTGAINGTQRTGGIAGQAMNADCCWNIGEITGATYTGGIFGQAKNYEGTSPSITKSFNAGNVSGGSYVGGIFGYSTVYSGYYPSTTANCYNVGTIIGTGDYIGGIGGYGYLCKYNNCYNAGRCIFGSGANNGAIFNKDARSESANNYYLEGCCGEDYYNGWTPVAERTADEMRAPDFMTTLGSAWLQDTEGYNSGYPILSGINYAVYAQYISSRGVITFDSSDYFVSVEDAVTIVAHVPDVNSLQQSDITWVSSNEAIAIVSTSATSIDNSVFAMIIVEGITPGVATVTITIPDGRSASCEVVVGYSLELYPSWATIQVGDSITINANGLFELDSSLSSTDIVWSVADESVLTVVNTEYNVETGSAFIELKAISTGTTGVTCSVKNLEHKTCDIRVELDRWSFANSSSDNMGKWPAKDGYYISLSDYSRLIGGLSKTDRWNVSFNTFLQSTYNLDGLRILAPTFQEWNGSCHGMSIWVCLVAANALSPSVLHKSLLYEIDQFGELSRDTQSAINYYHFQQRLSCYKQEVDAFESYEQNEQLELLRTYAEEAESDGNPFLIEFQWYREFEEDGKCKTSSSAAHAVVGYGLETGNWTIVVNDEIVTYKNRIRIYDCARDSNIHYSDYDLYFTDTGIWCIPAWEVISKNTEADSKDNNGHLILVTNDVSLLNSVDYLSGKISAAVSSQIVTLSTSSDSIYTLSTTTGDYTIQGFSVLESTGDEKLNIFLNDNITVNRETAPTTSTIVLPRENINYTIESDDDSMAFALTFENYLEAAVFDSAGSITFNANGGLTVNADEPSNYYLSLTANDGYYTLPWYTIAVTGSNSSDISAALIEEGIILAGDNWEDVTVYGINDEETVELKFRTDADSVLVTDNETNNELMAWVDTDGDGTYETPLTNLDNSITYTITFNPNGGSVDTTTTTTGANGKLGTLPIPTREGYTFEGWYTAAGDGTKVTTETVFTKDTTIYAHWTENTLSKNTIIVNASPAEGGSVTGGGTYDEGKSVTVGASPASGYRFIRWTENGLEVSTSATYEFTAEANRTLTAVFELINSGGGGGSTPSNPSYQITVSTTSNGTVTVSPTSAKASTKVTITATPDEGYMVDTIAATNSSGNSISVTDNGDGTYTFTMPASQVTVRVTFVAIETPWVNPFTDVSESDWFYDGVAYVARNGLMQGVGGGKFNPSGTTSRGMIVTILYRLEGEPAVSQPTFTDVAVGQYYTEAVAWAAANKIVEGYGNNTFGPNDAITREQMATILYRYADYKGYDVSGRADLSGYTDTQTISSWALTAIRWANRKSLITGRTTTTLVPKGTATRAEAAVILSRFCQDIAGIE